MILALLVATEMISVEAGTTRLTVVVAILHGSLHLNNSLWHGARPESKLKDAVTHSPLLLSHLALHTRYLRVDHDEQHSGVILLENRKNRNDASGGY